MSSVFMVTLKCTAGCHETFRIGRHEPGGTHLSYKYCPVCGMAGVMAECDSEADWWTAMCEAAELPQVVLEPIYELWRTDVSAPRFMDYVQKFKSSSTSLYDEVMKHSE